MDLPFSVPRLYIAAIFAVAACAAAAGAGHMSGRRTWWSAIAASTAGIAAIKAGSVVHKEVLQALGGYTHPLRGLLLTAPMFVAVLAWLWWLSRDERRDRRRVIGSLGLYAVASIGLSAVSSWLEDAYGHASVWATSSTFVEESGEMLAAVAVLTAVLLGVAPRLVLPQSWPLRRTADEHTVEVAAPAAAPRLGAPRAW